MYKFLKLTIYKNSYFEVVPEEVRGVRRNVGGLIKS